MSTEIKHGKTKTTEFKASFQKEVIELVVAFANTKGGKVFIGISNNGEVLGIEVKQESLQNWINQIKLSISHSLIFNIKEENIEGKTIVVIDICGNLLNLENSLKKS